jgi:transposase-like protein
MMTEQPEQCPVCGSDEFTLEPDNTANERSSYWLCDECEEEFDA